MWFDDLKGESVVMDYEVHNEAYSYDEDYSESSSEFFLDPSTGGSTALSFAQVSIMSAVIRKLKNCLG